MLTKAVKFLANPLYAKYQDVMQRISALETAIDCLVERPRYVAAEHVGFNGQRHRKRIFLELLELFDFNVIVETGTWTGDTTGYMRQESGLPVATCELNKRFCGIAKLRLKDLDQIAFHWNDSRNFLREFCAGTSRDSRALAYLDAHWYDDLPLADEIEILCRQFAGDFVLMIDDFEVPGDRGYGYDDYGRHRSLSFATFAPEFARHGLTAFSPRALSDDETGARRGCVVLARGSQALKLQSARTLRTS